MTDFETSQTNEPLPPSEPVNGPIEPSNIPVESPPVAEEASVDATVKPVAETFQTPPPASPPPPTPPYPENPPQKHLKKRGSLFFPILLIVVGLVLLLNNLNLIPGSAWDTLINLWPALFIVWGLDSIWREEGLTGAVFLLGLGVVFLLANFGYIQLNPWQVLLVIWPVLLIAIGMDILLSRRRTWWANILGLIVIIALMAGALWLAGVGQTGSVAVSGQEVNYPLQGATRADVQILPAVGTIELGGSVAPETLLAGTIPASTPGQQIVQEFSRQGDKAVLTLRSTGVQYFYPATRGNQAIWKLGLNSQVPIDLEVSFGAADGTLDLTGLQISSLDFNMGVGAVTIILPAEGKFTANVNGAIGKVTLIIPEGMTVQLESNSLLVAKNLPADFEKSGSVYSSAGFSQSDNQVTLDLGMVFGQVIIEEK